jgi:hypothetical protein
MWMCVFTFMSMRGFSHVIPPSVFGFVLAIVGDHEGLCVCVCVCVCVGGLVIIFF